MGPAGPEPDRRGFDTGLLLRRDSAAGRAATTLRSSMPVSVFTRAPARLATRQIGRFSHHVLAKDLPALPDERRAAAVAFTMGRAERMPSPMKLGVGAVALMVGALGQVVGTSRLAEFTSRHSPPLLGDYVRFIRSLGYAYIWETWPATRCDGAPG